MNGSRVRAFNAGDTWHILGRHATDSIAVTILRQMPHTEIDDFFLYKFTPKMWYLFDFFQIQCSVLLMFCRQFRCSIYKTTAGRWTSWIGVLRKPPDPSPNFVSPPSARRLSVFASFKKDFSYGHGFYVLVPAMHREANPSLAVRRASVQRSRYKQLAGRLHNLREKYHDSDLTALQLLRECANVYGSSKV